MLMISGAGDKAMPITGGPSRRAVEVSALLGWAYREELPKRPYADRSYKPTPLASWLELNARIDSGSGSGDPGFLSDEPPHPDALEVEAAVNTLPNIVIDWHESIDAIMGDLAGLLDINALIAPEMSVSRVTKSSWPTKHYDKTGQRAETTNRPRDVLMVGTIQTSALIASHAAKGTRPKWFPEYPTCHATPARNASQAAIVGECRGKNFYSTGSHCPLTWRPSPITIAQCRADYIGWWRGLTMLAESLALLEHTVLPPAAPRLPWLEPESESWLYGQRVAPSLATRVAPSLATLPLKPQRPLAGRTRGQGEDVPRRYPGRRINDG